LIHEPVQEGDTLQRVALRYGVPDSEIRRANNLYTDQDFFALKTVKIPIKEHSLLTETMELEKRRKIATSGTGGSENQSESNSDETRLGGPSTYYKSEDEEDSGDADDEKGDSDTPEYRNVSIQSALKWKHSGDSLLKKFDEDLERVRANTEQKVQNHRDVAVTLHHPKFYPVTRTSYEKSLLTNVEWRWYVWGGLAVIGVILLMLIVRTIWCHKHGTHCKLLPMGR
jgi:murein DD-endopeptidase MepM/ murein hydrolase activator NlpD